MVFSAPYFLFGFIAIAIPVIIHLVQLRKPKKVFFTNVGFIRKIEKVTANQRQLKHWLILLSRILFISFLALLFSQPFIPAHDSLLSKATEAKIYLDNSLSMQNGSETGNHSLLEQATDDVSKMVPNLPANTTIQLLDNSFKATSNRDFSKNKLAELLGNLTYSPLTRSTENIFSRLNNTSQQTATYFFSDFQKSSFQPGFLAKSDTVSPVNLIVMKPAAKANVYIDSVALKDELLRPNETNHLTVTLFNSGDEIKKGTNLKLFIDKQLVSSISVDLAAKTATAAEIDFRVPENGTFPARLEIEDQPVSFDNTYYFTLKTARATRILDITPNPDMLTGKLFVNEPLFKYQSERPGSVNYSQLSASDLVLVNELPSIDNALTDNLQKFVSAGGSLVIVPNEKPDKSVYESFFKAFNLPVTFLSAEKPASALAHPDLNNPFFRNIFTAIDNRLQMPAAPQMLGWTRADASILSYRNGSGFLGRFTVGKGQVYVFAAPFSEEANTFSRNALFVPVLYKLALNSYQAEMPLAYHFGQRNFSFKVPRTDIRKSVFSLENDSLKYVPEQQLRNGRMVFTLPSEMARAGFYKLKHNDSTLALLAFNYPKAESNLETYSAEELRSLIPNKNVKVFESGDGVGFSEQMAQETKGTPLWQYCLSLVPLFPFS